MTTNKANLVHDDLRAGLLAVLPKLRRFALSLTGTAADADDLVQNACEKVLKHGGQLRDHTRIDAWMYGIMRNVWVDEIRGRKVRRTEHLDSVPETAGEDGTATTEGRLGLAEVRRALAHLPEEQRTVLVLVCVDGLSYRESAEILGVPLGTVMSRLSRGRQALNDLLNGKPVTDNVTPFTPRAARGAL
jgi:RNA polymerase sigma-70 factor (ECF subfamily)